MAAPAGQPPPAEAGHDALLRRGAKGAVALGLRQVLVQGLGFAGAVALARLLTPAEFGVYGITLFLLHFLAVFADAGLAAGLVREEAEPSEKDWKAVFTFQQCMVLAACALGAVFGPAAARFVGTETDLTPLVPATLAALVLASFQTVPVARLERRLDFGSLAVVEVFQAVAFNFAAVGAALAGLGTWSMATALVARAAAGVAAVRAVTPFGLGWTFDWPRVRSRLRYGLAFQGSALLSLVREAVLPVYVGATLGETVVGGVFWGRMLALYPIIVVYMFQRLLLPLFARLQSRRAELASAIETSLFAVTALAVPVQTTVLALQEPVTRLVFGEQWLEWLPVYRTFWLAGVLEPQVLVAMALLNALGGAGRTFVFLAWLTAGTWLLGVPLIALLGPVGLPASAVVMLAVKWKLLGEADEAAGTSSFAVVAPVWGAGLASAAVTAALAAWTGVPGLVALVGWALFAAALYLALLVLAAPKRARAALAWIRAEAGFA